MKPLHQQIVLDVAALPTAPFVESAIHDYVRGFARTRRSLRARADRWGNLMVDYASGRRNAAAGPLWFAAHSDHPGFVADRMVGKNKLRAYWFGGVAASFFKDEAVTFFVPRGQAYCRVSGRISRTVLGGPARKRAQFGRPVESVIVEVDEPAPGGTVGMWGLADPKIVGSRLFARSHDDTTQVAALLCLLDELDRKRPAGRVTCAFTRAEENGFVGAIGLARDGTLPHKAVYISLECSDAVAASAKAGDGPILRVGDRTTTFDQPTLSWMDEVAHDLASGKSQRKFHHQRKLMSGGTCESTAVIAFGHITGAICLPLLNYHNMNPATGRIDSEIIDLVDFEQELVWLEELVRQSARRATINQPLVRGMNERFRKYGPLLKKWWPDGKTRG
jgi:endoglucanase